MIVRPARPDDLPVIARISEANDEPVSDPDRPGSRYLEHLLRHGQLLVAERDGAVVGFSGTIDVPAGWFLTDLFVDPAAHGQGVGRALLAEAFPDGRPRLTFSSSDPRALPIYLRAGLAPWWPLLLLRAPAPAATDEPGGATIERIEPAAAAALELELSGHDRTRDWNHWAATPGHVMFRIVDRGRAAAVGFRTPSRLGRLVLGPDADPIAVVLAAVAPGPPGSASALAIPGPHPAVGALLDRGWRVEGQDLYMASGPDLIDPTRLLPDESLA
ncbi:MAG TPA: GNAT family N-acetyltransferase [Patescibacteria group bacterium]|nr:GNAT family N-acetyltransferase [Patescibacteria group bacterium]